MRKLIIFGKPIIVVEKRSRKDSIEFKDNKIAIKSFKAYSSLLKEFLIDLLYSELCSIYEEIKNGDKVELFGNLNFEVVEKIDGRKERIAKFKGNKILVKLSAIALPKEALKYVVAHELAHLSTKKHTKRFWKVVEVIYPEYKVGEELLGKHKLILKRWDNREIKRGE